ncbi:MAG: TIGR03915 family putative DNA repair protein [Candidatus Adiutrix sp.]|jgi:probable DNA metabolism protein|nr:TIGR03915 family putative DNA repair protein [Candidatus Adiutrix sp.]
MIVFVYEQSFEGLLSAVFEAFRLRLTPDALCPEGERPPLLATEIHRAPGDPEKSARVWAGLEKKLSGLALKQILYAWLSEEPGAAELVIRYLRAVYSGTAETDFAHPDVMALRRTAFKVSREKEHLRQFLRFQKTRAGVYFAAVVPRCNVLPLVLGHFADRFADQQWIIYDLNRQYGYYYDLESLRETDRRPPVDPASGRLAEEELAGGEALLQEAWRAYFKSVSIAQRANPRLQRQFMPRRFWPYLTETQLFPLTGAPYGNDLEPDRLAVN